MTHTQAQVATHRILLLEERIKSLSVANGHNTKGSSDYIHMVTIMTEFELEIYALRESLKTCNTFSDGTDPEDRHWKNATTWAERHSITDEDEW